jgi:hypothetical protein
MSTTLSDGVTAVNLGADLRWQDEMAWAPVEQSTERTITGALIVQAAVRTKGRPITLGADDDASGWVDYADLLQLYAWASLPGQVLTLTHQGIARQVMWRHQDGAITATPVVPFADPMPGDSFRVRLALFEV